MAVRREMEAFELAQIWTTDPKIDPLDDEQRDRMEAEFKTTAIPLHVIVDPFTGENLATFRYDPRMEPGDYIDFLKRGMAAFRAARGGG